MAKRKSKLTRQELKELLPVAKELNPIAKLFIKTLNRNIEQKKKKINTIRVMLDGPVKFPKHQHTLSIHALDLKNTVISSKKKGVFKQTMKWEDDFRKKNRGIIL